MVMSDPGADQPGMQHDRNQCCKSDQWRNGSGEEPHQQRWPCLAAVSYTHLGVSFLYHPAVKAAVPDEKIETEETMAASTAAASTEAETQSAWIPTLEELNLVHYFPEGGDETDITKSLAGHVFHELMTRDANWSSALYSYSDVTPADVAAKLGISRERILGKYNPEDISHQKENPSTWTIGSFRNVRIQAVDGDGHAV